MDDELEGRFVATEDQRMMAMRTEQSLDRRMNGWQRSRFKAGVRVD